MPKEYYLLDNKDDDHMKTASISRGGKLCLSYQVDVAGSVLRFAFHKNLKQLLFYFILYLCYLSAFVIYPFGT